MTDPGIPPSCPLCGWEDGPDIDVCPFCGVETTPFGPPAPPADRTPVRPHTPRAEAIQYPRQRRTR